MTHSLSSHLLVDWSLVGVEIRSVNFVRPWQCLTYKYASQSHLDASDNSEWYHAVWQLYRNICIYELISKMRWLSCLIRHAENGPQACLADARQLRQLGFSHVNKCDFFFIDFFFALTDACGFYWS